jgi:hypothetical protein
MEATEDEARRNRKTTGLSVSSPTCSLSAQSPDETPRIINRPGLNPSRRLLPCVVPGVRSSSLGVVQDPLSRAARSAMSTGIYANVDITMFRRVADFDLGVCYETVRSFPSRLQRSFTEDGYTAVRSAITSAMADEGSSMRAGSIRLVVSMFDIAFWPKLLRRQSRIH